MRLFTGLLATCAISLTLGCPRPLPPPVRDLPPPPPPVKIPAGCEADLSGRYVHADESTYRYLGADDGGTLLLTVNRVLPERADAGPAAPLAQIHLHRTPDGFEGTTRAEGFAAGVKCPLVFETEVTACADAGLSLRTAMTAAVDEQCRVAPPTGVTPREEHQLLRLLPDGGLPSSIEDAGAASDAGATSDAGADAEGRTAPADAGSPVSTDGGAS